MEQRSDAWHEARRGVINASEAGSLLGLNPYTSAKAARKAWIARRDGKRDKDIGHLPDVRRGIDLEPAILNKIEHGLDIIVQQDGGRGVGDGSDDYWLRASADGYDDLHVVEVKAPRKIFNLEDRPDYALQVYLQMICYEKDLGIFAQGVEMGPMQDLFTDSRVVTKKELLDIIGIPDPVKVLHALWMTMMDEDAPEAAVAPEGFEDASSYYLTAKAGYTAAKELLDEAKAALLAVTNNSEAVGERLQVVEQTRQGSVNMKALTKDHPEIDLDQYRGEPTIYLTIREVK
jgi:hypothetical protein